LMPAFGKVKQCSTNSFRHMSEVTPVREYESPLKHVQSVQSHRSL
jgi:hypothetical protein